MRPAPATVLVLRPPPIIPPGRPAWIERVASSRGTQCRCRRHCATSPPTRTDGIDGLTVAAEVAAEGNVARMLEYVSSREPRAAADNGWIVMFWPTSGAGGGPLPPSGTPPMARRRAAATAACDPAKSRSCSTAAIIHGTPCAACVVDVAIPGGSTRSPVQVLVRIAADQGSASAAADAARVGSSDEPAAKSCAPADAMFGPNGAWELFARSTATVEGFATLLAGEPPSAAGNCAAKPSLGKTEGASCQI